MESRAQQFGWNRGGVLLGSSLPPQYPSLSPWHSQGSQNSMDITLNHWPGAARKISYLLQVKDWSESTVLWEPLGKGARPQEPHLPLEHQGERSQIYLITVWKNQSRHGVWGAVWNKGNPIKTRLKKQLVGIMLNQGKNKYSRPSKKHLEQDSEQVTQRTNLKKTLKVS